MTTHYIAAFTERNGHQQRAACGRWVQASEHSNEPDCAGCRDYLAQDAADEAETLRALGLAKIDGFIVPKEMR